MGELLGFLGFVAGLWFLVAPGLALASASRARKRAEELDGRLLSLELELSQLRENLRAARAASQLSARPQPAPVLPAAPAPVFAPVVAPVLAPPEPVQAHAEPILAQTEPISAPIEPALPQIEPIPAQPEPAQAQPETTAAPPAPAPSLKPWSPSLLPEGLLGGLSPASQEASEPSPSDAPAEQVPSLKSTGFDIEKLLGVRGAAWLGAIALAIAGTLFAKYSIENNLIPPAVRIALLIIIGAGALLASEWPLRPRYTPTANSVAGAGIAVLYSAFYAGHSLYGLFDTKVTFALMILTTVVAALLSIRYDAMFIAGLGLVGGFATPLLLSTGQDRPVALFLYILLLDIGFLVMAVRRGWHLITLISLFLTLAIQGGWLALRLEPAKLRTGLGFATLFSLLYLALPSVAVWVRGRSDDESEEKRDAQQNQTLMVVSLVAGVAPLLLALHIATTTDYAGQWPLLYGFLGCLNAALLVVAVRRAQAPLLIAAAAATVLSIIGMRGEPAWVAAPWGATLGTIGLFMLPNLGGRLAALWPPKAKPVAEHADLLEAAGLVGVVGLVIYTALLFGKARSDHPWLAWTLELAIFALLWERSAGHRTHSGLRYVATLGALALGGLGLMRLVAATSRVDEMDSWAHIVLRELAGPALLAMLYGVLASWRGLGAKDEPAKSRVVEWEAAVLAACGWGLVGLSYCVSEHTLSANPVPLVACLFIYDLMLVLVALRRTWTALMPLMLVVTAGLVTGWHVDNFQKQDAVAALLVYGLLYALFLGLPLLLVYRNQRSWQLRRGPYLASALAGAAFFPAVYDAVTRSIGKAAIGLLPLLFAFGAVLGLTAVQRLPKPPADWMAPELAARRRLGHRALFAAMALGFVTLAVPLQLDRQWIIVAWALEAAAVMRLFGLLPHPGLKYFGMALYLLVAARLLLDPHVLELQPRGYVVVNWLLYTYGVPAACFLFGAAWLRAVEVDKHDPWERQLFGKEPRLATAVAFVGLVLVFALINLEISDAFSTGKYAELSFERSYARDLTTSLAWALYGIVLLIVGMWRKTRALRFVSLGFLVLTILKVFLLDLSNLKGVYRPLSFLGLAASLIFVSLLYQRFVFGEEKKGKSDAQ